MFRFSVFIGLFIICSSFFALSGADEVSLEDNLRIFVTAEDDSFYEIQLSALTAGNPALWHHYQLRGSLVGVKDIAYNYNLLGRLDLNYLGNESEIGESTEGKLSPIIGSGTELNLPTGALLVSLAFDVKRQEFFSIQSRSGRSNLMRVSLNPPNAVNLGRVEALIYEDGKTRLYKFSDITSLTFEPGSETANPNDIFGRPTFGEGVVYGIGKDVSAINNDLYLLTLHPATGVTTKASFMAAPNTQVHDISAIAVTKGSGRLFGITGGQLNGDQLNVVNLYEINKATGDTNFVVNLSDYLLDGTKRIKRVVAMAGFDSRVYSRSSSSLKDFDKPLDRDDIPTCRGFAGQKSHC